MYIFKLFRKIKINRLSFFRRIESNNNISSFYCIAKISGTEAKLKRMKPEGHEISDENTAQEITENARRGPFRFSECDIPVGAIVTFVDDPTIQAEVLDDRHVRYNKETTSLSSIVQRIKGVKSIQGPMFFTYEGEKLTDRRIRLERSNH